MSKRRTLKQLIKFIHDAANLDTNSNYIHRDGGHVTVRTTKKTFVVLSGTPSELNGVVGGTNTYFLSAIFAARQFNMISQNEYVRLYGWWCEEHKTYTRKSEESRVRDAAERLGYTLTKRERE